MDDIRKIMVAIGFSDYAQGLFNYGVRMARLMEADLLVANVINSRDVEAIDGIASMGYDLDPHQYVEGLKAERKKAFDRIVEACPEYVENLRLIFRVGNPIDELLKVIVRENVDTVVMGIKGRTDLRQILVGSVAEKIFRKSPVTVISYREGAPAERLRKRIHL